MRHITPNESYNAAIDDAKAALAREVEKNGNEQCFELFIKAVSRMEGLKRRINQRPNRKSLANDQDGA